MMGFYDQVQAKNTWLLLSDFNLKVTQAPSPACLLLDLHKHVSLCEISRLPLLRNL